MGFEISKPSIRWYFETELDSTVRELTGLSLSPRFQGGVMVTTYAGNNVLVHVYDKSELRNMTLSEYIDWQIELGRCCFGENILVLSKDTSRSQDWARFTALRETHELTLYSEQILQIKGERLYAIQYTGRTLESVPALKGEVEEIMSSFRILS